MREQIAVVENAGVNPMDSNSFAATQYNLT